jgi:hypothetical protein
MEIKHAQGPALGLSWLLSSVAYIRGSVICSTLVDLGVRERRKPRLARLYPLRGHTSRSTRGCCLPKHFGPNRTSLRRTCHITRDSAPLESEWRKVTTEWTIAGVPVWEVNGQLERQLPVAKDWSKEGTCCCTLDEVDLAKPPVVGGSFGAPTYLFVVSRDDGPKGRVFYGLLIQRYTDSGRQARGTSATQAEESKWVRVGLGELQVDPHIESFSSEFTTTVTII